MVSSFITFPRKVVGLMICWSCLFRLRMEQTAVLSSSSFCNRYVRFANYLFSLWLHWWEERAYVQGSWAVRSWEPPGWPAALDQICTIASPKKVGVYMGWQFNAEMLLTMDMGGLGRTNCSWESWRIVGIAPLHGKHEEQKKKQKRWRLKSKWASQQCVTIVKLDNSYTFSSSWARCPLYTLSCDST